MSRYLYIVFLIVFVVSAPFFSSGQEAPVLKPQTGFTLGLDEVLSSSRQNTFLVESGDNYVLVDQATKLQLGTLIFNPGDWGSPGEGKTAMYGDSSFLLSTAHVILEADPITGRVDTFFSQNKFPEMIEHFMPWPGNEEWVLVATKIYEMDKDSNITYLNPDKRDVMEYLGGKNCRLYLYDGINKKVLKIINTPHYITAFSPELKEGSIIAGTFEGDIIQIEPDLTVTNMFRAFEVAVHTVSLLGEYIIACPHQDKKYIGMYGSENLYIFKNNKKENKITFAKQKPGDDDGYSMVGPSGKIFRIFSLPAENCIVVNYGFSRLVKITFPAMDTSHYPIDYNMAKFYCLDKDSIRLLGAMDDNIDLFASAKIQGMYDLKREKFQPAFRDRPEQKKFNKYYKIVDAKGNYHIIGYKFDYSGDTLVVFSSNKTEPAQVACKWCRFSFDPQNNVLAAIQNYGSNTIAGAIDWDALTQSNYVVNLNEEGEKIIKPDFTLKKIDEKYLPEELYSIAKITDNAYILRGKDKLLISDTTGKIIFTQDKFEPLMSDAKYAISPSRKWLAFVSEKNDRHQLEIWDWKSGNKVFAEKYGKKEDIRHYTFDKTIDVLWFVNDEYNIYKIDLRKNESKPELVFNDESYFSFETDMQNDLIASESYDEIKLARLSTREILWKTTPAYSFFDIRHQANGFAYSSSKEFHIITAKNNYLYFTTFAGNKSVEVVNGYLYRGDKSAVNNLGFVYKRKGYLPGDYDVYFNRPDTVIVLSGSSNTEYNQLLAKAQGKRRRAAASVDLNELLTNSPQLQVTNKNLLPFVINGKTIALEIKIESVSGIPLDALHVVVNGVPAFGTGGMPITVNEFTVNIPIETGANTLQVFATDKKGISSLSETISVVADYAAASSKTYFIGIGIDKFKDSAQNLSYSVKDIRDLAAALKTKLGENIIIDTLFNKDVSVANVRAIKQKLLQTGVNDRVLVSYSGHGLLNKNFDYYLSTYAINFRQPETAGLPYTDLEYLLDSIPARKKLLLIDACHSGEVDREELDKMKVILGDTAKHLSDGGKSGIELLVEATPAVGLKNSFELMQELFVNVGRGTGATIISAAAGTQVAYEKGALKNGVFTYCILQLMAEKENCTVQQLKQYVSEEVEKHTNGLQKPTSRNETVGFDWEVW